MSRPAVSLETAALSQVWVVLLLLFEAPMLRTRLTPPICSTAVASRLPTTLPASSVTGSDWACHRWSSPGRSSPPGPRCRRQGRTGSGQGLHAESFAAWLIYWAV